MLCIIQHEANATHGGGIRQKEHIFIFIIDQFISNPIHNFEVEIFGVWFMGESQLEIQHLTVTFILRKYIYCMCSYVHTCVCTLVCVINPSLNINVIQHLFASGAA